MLDGVGIGELPDADFYGDAGSNTLGNISKVTGGLNLPNLTQLGLGNIAEIKGVPPVSKSLASFGKMIEKSKGKDSTTGHWEIAGLHVKINFSYFPNGFPESLISEFLKETGCKGVLGNKAASGTEIIEELGDKHIETGFPIIYTSADSVFQIAAHEEIIPLQELYRLCIITRTKVLQDPVNIGRVIARPFTGKSNYKRTVNRKDFSIDPPAETILDILSENKITTVAIGKVNDLFNGRGINIRENTKSNEEGFLKLLECSIKFRSSFIFANLVDFDVYYGHRNDPAGFASALKEFDDFLPSLLKNVDKTDAVIITADHGNDPTTSSTDHSREYVPLLFFRKEKESRNLEIRKTFSDIAKTASDFFDTANSLEGESFL